MKRSSSSAFKENPSKHGFTKYSYRHQLGNTEQLKLLCSPKTSLDYCSRDSHLTNGALAELCKTFVHSNLVELSRPETKQTMKRFVRPETSKGVRTSEKSFKKWQPQVKQGFCSQYGERKERQQQENEGTLVTNIEIIVTQSNRKKAEKPKLRDKFQTDLDDEFLQLFAN